MRNRMRYLLAVVLALSMILVPAPALAEDPPSEVWVCPTGDCGQGVNGYNDIQAAVDAVAVNGTVHIMAGTYVLPGTVTVNKAGVTLAGAGRDVTKIETSGTAYTLELMGNGVTLQDVQIEKTDKAGTHNIVYIGASNVKVLNNLIWGHYVMGDPQVERAMEIAGGLSGLLIEGNTIHHLRQPAYINSSSGTIRNNYVFATRGWVLEGANVTFEGNTWGTGADANYVDIAILSVTPAGNYPDILAVSRANNDAVVEDQRPSPAVLTRVLVDAAAGPGGDGTPTNPYNTISAAIPRVVAGGTVNVAAGTYIEQVEIAKDLTLQGAGSGTVIRSPDTLAISFTTGTNTNKPVLYVHDANAATVEELVVDGAGKGKTNHRFMGIAYYNAGGAVRNVEIKGVRDTPFSGVQHGVALYAYNTDGAARTLVVEDCNIHDFQKNAMALIGAGLNVTVSGNTLTGQGPTGVTAQNGIQVSSGAGGVIGPNNQISGISYTGPNWAASSILVYDGTVDVTKNTISNGQVGVYFGPGAGTISENVVTSSSAGAGVDAYWGIIATDPPEALPSPYTDAPAAGGQTAGAAFAASAVNTVTVDDNVLTGGDDSDVSIGLEVDGGYSDDDLAFSASGNVITGWGIGVAVSQCESGCQPGTLTSVEVHENNLAGNRKGIEADRDVNAEKNWWGAASGPSGVGPGSGSAVSAHVDYSPWWGDETGSFTVEQSAAGEIVIPAGMSTAQAQAILDGAAPGSTILLAAGAHTGGLVLRRDGVTIKGEAGATVGHGSPAFTIAANGVTLDGLTLDGTGDTSGASGIVVNAGVSNLWVRNCEIKNWPADGIHFNGAISGVKLVDNRIHHNGGDGVEFTQAPAGVVQIYGNSFRANGGLGINAGTAEVTAEYNEWGGISGPNGAGGDGASAGVDAEPWVFGKVYAQVAASPKVVRETETVDVDVWVVASTLYGAQVELSYDPAELTVVSVTKEGTGYFKGSYDSTVEQTTGKLKYYCTRSASDMPYNGTIKLFTVTFKAEEMTGVDLEAELALSGVKLSAPGGVNIYVDSVVGDSVTILGTTTVQGVVDLQGRDDDSGTIVDVAAGAVYGWHPAAITTGAWGGYSFANMTDDCYTFTARHSRYLAASKTVDVAGDAQTLITVMLLGGDADTDGDIDINDLSTIGGKFGLSVPAATTDEDINADGMVDILDLVLAAGNYNKTASEW